MQPIIYPSPHSLTIGGTNSSQYTGNIQYFNLPATGPSARGFWGLVVDEVTLNGTPLNLSSENAILDRFDPTPFPFLQE